MTWSDGELGDWYVIDDHRWYVLDLADYYDDSVAIVDGETGRWFRIAWVDRSIDGSTLVPCCSCGVVTWDAERHAISSDACVHYAAYQRFFQQHLFEPVS